MTLTIPGAKDVFFRLRQYQLGSLIIRKVGSNRIMVNQLKFMFSKKTTKIDEIFTVNLTLCSKCQIDSEDSLIFVAILENTNFKTTFPLF